MDNTHWGRFVVIAIAMAVAATVLGIYTAGDNVIAVDVRIAHWLQQWQGTVPENLEAIGDMSGDTPTAMATVVGGVLIAATMRSWRMTAFFLTVGILRVLGTGLKPMFGSPRPTSDRVSIYEISDGFGYPSGHSMTAAMIAAIVVVIAWNIQGLSRYRWMITALAAALALLVGWSRVWSGAHWPTDVLGGWSYGVVLVMFAWALATRTAGSRND